MLVKCPVIVPLIELQVTKCVHQKGSCYMERNTISDSVEKYECLGN